MQYLHEICLVLNKLKNKIQKTIRHNKQLNKYSLFEWKYAIC